MYRLKICIKYFSSKIHLFLGVVVVRFLCYKYFDTFFYKNIIISLPISGNNLKYNDFNFRNVYEKFFNLKLL